MIIHVDMDAFYASVEIRDNPSLAGKPVVVGGSVSGRGVIAAASYEARKFGVHSAMSSKVALRKCPDLVFVKGRMEHYAAISRQIRDIFFNFTSLVEPLSLDEAFLDVGGCERLFGDALTIATAIKKQILDETQLIASAGVAPNKYLAKIASDYDKPDGLTFVDPNNIQGFLDPLPISRVWGIGPVTEQKFARLGVSNVRQLRTLSLELLQSELGINGDHFYRLARGIDDRDVVPDRVAKSVSHEKTFPTDIFDDEVLAAWLLELTDQVARRMRRHEIFAKTIKLKFRFDDFETLVRNKSISPTNTTQTMFETAAELMAGIYRNQRRGVRLIGMGVSNLSRPAPVQLTLFDQAEKDKQSRVDHLSDAIRDKFGAAKLHRGTNLEHDIRLKPDPRIGNE
ncbi:DNA polymerase IV [bacterium]|nr:DNA polymerase IV [bacterium]